MRTRDFRRRFEKCPWTFHFRKPGIPGTCQGLAAANRADAGCCTRIAHSECTAELRREDEKSGHSHSCKEIYVHRGEWMDGCGWAGMRGVPIIKLSSVQSNPAISTLLGGAVPGPRKPRFSLAAGSQLRQAH